MEGRERVRERLVMINWRKLGQRLGGWKSSFGEGACTFHQCRAKRGPRRWPWRWSARCCGRTQIETRARPRIPDRGLVYACPGTRRFARDRSSRWSSSSHSCAIQPKIWFKLTNCVHVCLWYPTIYLSNKEVLWCEWNEIKSFFF